MCIFIIRSFYFRRLGVVEMVEWVNFFFLKSEGRFFLIRDIKYYYYFYEKVRGKLFFVEEGKLVLKFIEIFNIGGVV